MKVISWNVNGLRSIAEKRALEDLVREHSPDLLFLQELKCSEDQVDQVTSRYANSLRGDYIAYVDASTIPGRHGVAMFAKEHLDTDESPITWLPNVDPKVDGQPEARLQVFIIRGVLFIHTYTVNSRQDLSRVPQRKEYDDEILKILDDWGRNGGDKAIVIGDFNVVSELEDYHGPSLSPTTSGMTDSERTSFKVLLKAHNLKDTFRELHPNEVKYTYWSYRGYARDNNKGWRIDLALTSESLFPYVESCDILTDVYGSDHAPIVLEIKDL